MKLLSNTNRWSFVESALAPDQFSLTLSVLSSLCFSVHFHRVCCKKYTIIYSYIKSITSTSTQITNTNNILLHFKYVILATTSTNPTPSLACPAKDTKCAAPDGSNVIMRMSTEDDAECGG